jgi:hypothetical protein
VKNELCHHEAVLKKSTETLLSPFYCLAWQRVKTQNNRRQKNRVLDIESIQIAHRQNTLKFSLHREYINTVPQTMGELQDIKLSLEDSVSNGQHLLYMWRCINDQQGCSVLGILGHFSYFSTLFWYFHSMSITLNTILAITCNFSQPTFQ